MSSTVAWPSSEVAKYLGASVSGGLRVTAGWRAHRGSKQRNKGNLLGVAQVISELLRQRVSSLGALREQPEKALTAASES
jgi:hypothetical protein